MGEPLGFRLVGLEQIVGDALGRFGAYARQASQLVEQALEGMAI